MKLKKRNWNGIDHSKINDRFEGDLSYVNDLNLGNDVVASVYRAKSPNREKGHKEYLLLFQAQDPIDHRRHWMVAGMDSPEMRKHAKVKGVWCRSCDEVLYSLTRHDYHHCGCEMKAMVDGGLDYLRCGAKDLKKIVKVSINLLTDKITVDRKGQKRQDLKGGKHAEKSTRQNKSSGSRRLRS